MSRDQKFTRLHNFCLSFVLGIAVFADILKKTAYAKFWGANKVPGYVQIANVYMI